MYEYIITAFKVLVGLVNNERLALAAIVALCLMVLWVTFSLIFSFQRKFAINARKINQFVSRNGFSDLDGLGSLVEKMPNDFVRGYKRFLYKRDSLPSEYINRFESLDVELTGGVFNQNKSILKTYMNFIFTGLLLLSVAILAKDSALTGVVLAEASVIPLCFMVVAKVVYYVYTAIRQHQYRTAVEEFNEMLDNLDNSAKITFGVVLKDDLGGGQVTGAAAGGVGLDVAQTVRMVLDEYFVEKKDISLLNHESAIKVEETEQNLAKEEQYSLGNNEQLEEAEKKVEEDWNSLNDKEATQIVRSYLDLPTEESLVEETEEEKQEELFEENKEEVTNVQETEEVVENITETESEDVEQKLEEQTSQAEEISKETNIEESASEVAIEPTVDTQEDNIAGNELVEQENVENEESITVEEQNHIDELVEEQMKKDEKEEKDDLAEIKDNFNLDFAELVGEQTEETVAPTKRGRGRPRKEVVPAGEFVITNDKEFEEALARAEKLMRKNEEPLSASQTKRIEKQIKVLVDAMTKYKESK